MLSHCGTSPNTKLLLFTVAYSILFSSIWYMFWAIGEKKKVPYLKQMVHKLFSNSMAAILSACHLLRQRVHTCCLDAFEPVLQDAATLELFCAEGEQLFLAIHGSHASMCTLESSTTLHDIVPFVDISMYIEYTSACLRCNLVAVT